VCDGRLVAEFGAAAGHELLEFRPDRVVHRRLLVRIQRLGADLACPRRGVLIAGLSGLQYREFFTMLLPLYEQFGVPGAAEQLSAIHDDEPRRKALDELSAMYQDEDLMSTIPIEL
jgi:hypothetical protein